VSLQNFPDPLAVFRALLLKGEEEREDRKGRRGEGR